MPAIRPSRRVRESDAHGTILVQINPRLGISVHDHIIVGKNGHASLRGLKFI